MAIDLFNKAISLNPYSSKTYNYKGDAFLALGDNEEALHSYEQATRLRPDVSLYHCNKAKVLDVLHRHSEAIDSTIVAYRLQITTQQTDTIAPLTQTSASFEILKTLETAAIAFCQSEVGQNIAFGAITYLIHSINSSVGLSGESAPALDYHMG